MKFRLIPPERSPLKHAGSDEAETLAVLDSAPQQATKIAITASRYPLMKSRLPRPKASQGQSRPLTASFALSLHVLCHFFTWPSLDSPW